MSLKGLFWYKIRNTKCRLFSQFGVKYLKYRLNNSYFDFSPNLRQRAILRRQMSLCKKQLRLADMSLCKSVMTSYMLYHGITCTKMPKLAVVHLVGSNQVYLEAKNKETTFAKVVCFKGFLLAAGPEISSLISAALFLKCKTVKRAKSSKLFSESENHETFLFYFKRGNRRPIICPWFCQVIYGPSDDISFSLNYSMAMATKIGVSKLNKC